MQTTMQQLWAGVLENPKDAGLLLVTADCADEAGDEALAAGLRWCAAEGKFPTYRPMYLGWCWYWYMGDPLDAENRKRWLLDREDWGRISEPMWKATTNDFRFDPDPADHVRSLGRYLLTRDSQVSTMSSVG